MRIRASLPLPSQSISVRPLSLRGCDALKWWQDFCNFHCFQRNILVKVSFVKVSVWPCGIFARIVLKLVPKRPHGEPASRKSAKESMPRAETTCTVLQELLLTPLNLLLGFPTSPGGNFMNHEAVPEERQMGPELLHGYNTVWDPSHKRETVRIFPWFCYVLLAFWGAYPFTHGYIGNGFWSSLASNPAWWNCSCKHV